MPVELPVDVAAARPDGAAWTAPAGRADDAARGGAAGAPLGLHEGISHLRTSRHWREALKSTGGCPRWPATLRLLNETTGELIEGRCRATNQCEYCAKLAAIENAELLQLDAMYGPAPEIVAILGTADAERSPKPFYRTRELLVRALKRRWPDVQYAALVEFTTGYGPRSGGLRRPHWNLLLKGIPAGEVEAVREVVLGVWCRREKAEPHAQYVAPIADTGGLVGYVAKHFQKESQKPPEGWKGHRFLRSRGYLWAPTPEARAEARRNLRLKRVVWRETRAAEEQGVDLPPGVAWELAEAEVQASERTSWRLWRSSDHVPERGERVARPPAAARRSAAQRARAGAGPPIEACSGSNQPAQGHAERS